MTTSFISIFTTIFEILASRFYTTFEHSSTWYKTTSNLKNDVKNTYNKKNHATAAVATLSPFLY